MLEDNRPWPEQEEVWISPNSTKAFTFISQIKIKLTGLRVEIDKEQQGLERYLALTKIMVGLKDVLTFDSFPIGALSTVSVDGLEVKEGVLIYILLQNTNKKNYIVVTVEPRYEVVE